MASFVISGGDFLRTEGCLSFVDLDETTGHLSLRGETWLPHPRPHLAVPGKGITGLCVDGPTAWVCFSNLLARVALSDGAVLEVIEDEAFNDLHQLSFSERGLVLANTGNESLDIISLTDHTVTRIDLLGNELRALRPPRAQHADTKPHLHHMASACVNTAGDIILGLGRQARILNATRWTWIGPRMPSPIHDVHCGADAVWCTTVSGQVYRVDEDGTVRSWSLGDHVEQVGWNRGLAVTDRGLLVGTTAIRDSNRDYYRSLVNVEVGSVDASLTWVPFKGGEASVLKYPDARRRKIFSISPLKAQ